MKKLMLLLAISLICSTGFAYTWQKFGPENVNITKICFGVVIQGHVLCADDGFYLYNYGSNTSEFYTNGGLPVSGAAYFSPDKIMVTMGDGSWSDGIYTFDLNTHVFDVLEWVVLPKFLHYQETNSTWWVGSDWGGMWKSENGTDWAEVTEFLAKPCYAIASYGSNMVVGAISDLANIYWSDNDGQTWNPSELSPGFPDMSFGSFGLLLGVFPGYSNSSGLWKSTDFGQTWQIEIYQDNLITLGFDCFSDIFVGYDGQGLAYYQPDQGMTFLNDGLPGLHINKIQVNPTMSAPALFVSTDQGACYSLDYNVGMEDFQNCKPNAVITPNPAHDFAEIACDAPISTISVFTLSGKKVMEKSGLEIPKMIDTSGLQTGVYLIKIETSEGNTTQKLVVK